MKIIFKPEPKPIQIHNPYKDRLFTCDCGIKFLVEDEDITNIETKSIMKVDEYWYEHNMNRWDNVHYLKCECGRLVCLDDITYGGCWCEGTIKPGGELYKGENL